MRHCQACLATDHDLRACPSRNHRWGLRSIQEFARREGITVDRAREIEARAMAKLRIGILNSMLLHEERPRDMRLDPKRVPEDRTTAQQEMF